MEQFVDARIVALGEPVSRAHGQGTFDGWLEERERSLSKPLAFDGAQKILDNFIRTRKTGLMQTVGNAAIELSDDAKQPGLSVTMDEDTPIPVSDVHASAQRSDAGQVVGFEPGLAIDVSHLITEDDTPVDSVYSEKLERILTEPLYASWSGPPPQREGQRRPFAAFANVGLFSEVANTPIVPDVMLSIDVEIPKDILLKENRSYFIWKYGKFPDVVIEIVSNDEGGELDAKLDRYVQFGIRYYVVFDPLKELGETTLHVFELKRGRYVSKSRAFFPTVGLGVVEWRGSYEDMEALWLRWCLPDGTLVPTGAERAAIAETRAENEKRRADAAEQRARFLADRLRALGLDPEGGG